MLPVGSETARRGWSQVKIIDQIGDLSMLSEQLHSKMLTPDSYNPGSSKCFGFDSWIAAPCSCRNIDRAHRYCISFCYQGTGLAHGQALPGSSRMYIVRSPGERRSTSCCPKLIRKPWPNKIPPTKLKPSVLQLMRPSLLYLDEDCNVCSVEKTPGSSRWTRSSLRDLEGSEPRTSTWPMAWLIQCPCSVSRCESHPCASITIAQSPSA